MAWNNPPTNNPIPIRGTNLKRLLKRVRQLENQGYDHVKPYQKIYKTCKDYRFDINGNFGKGRFHFIGHEDTVEYLFVMKKVD